MTPLTLRFASRRYDPDALGISARPLQPRELFHPSTWTLEDR